MQMTLAHAPTQADLDDAWFDLSSGVLTHARSDASAGAAEDHQTGDDAEAAEVEDDEDEDHDEGEDDTGDDEGAEDTPEAVDGAHD